jgi:hypothetical protein
VSTGHGGHWRLGNNYFKNRKIVSNWRYLRVIDQNAGRFLLNEVSRIHEEHICNVVLSGEVSGSCC